MSSQLLYRWAGFAGVLGGILVAVASVTIWLVARDQPASVAATTNTAFLGVILGLLGNYLVLLALVGFYARQARNSGSLGLISFIVASAGSSMFIGFVWANVFIVPDLAVSAPEFLDAMNTAPSGKVAAGIISTIVLFSLGWAMAGITWLRAEVMPRLPVWLLTAGAILVVVMGATGLPVGDVLFGLAVSWLGWWLWSEKQAELTRAGAAAARAPQ